MFFTFLDKFVIWEFLLFSGGLRFGMSYPKAHLIIFLVTSFICYKHKIDKKLIIPNKNIKSRNIFTASCIIFWTIFNHLFINTDIVDNSYYSIIFYTLGAYFAISSFQFDFFREEIRKALTFICAISIVVHWAHVLGLLPSVQAEIGNSNVGMSLYFFNVDWGDNKLASIFWEPGQFQIILIYVLVLYIDELRNLHNYKVNLKKTGILFLSLVLTNSTTGYLSMFVLLVVIITFSEETKKYKKMIPIAIGLSVFLGYLILNSSVVQNKLNQPDDPEEGNNSLVIRLMDNIALLEMTQDSPTFGTGISTKTYEKKSEKYGNLTASNGWLYASATLGVPFLLFFWYTIYKNLRRRKQGIPAIPVMFVLIMSQANEYIPWFPIMFLYIYSFNQLKRVKPTKETKRVIQ